MKSFHFSKIQRRVVFYFSSIFLLVMIFIGVASIELRQIRQTSKVLIPFNNIIIRLNDYVHDIDTFDREIEKYVVNDDAAAYEHVSNVIASLTKEIQAFRNDLRSGCCFRELLSG